MRLAALLMLAFATLFSLWTITGIRIIRCAMGITLAEDMEFDEAIRPGKWLFTVANARREAGGASHDESGESL